MARAPIEAGPTARLVAVAFRAYSAYSSVLSFVFNDMAVAVIVRLWRFLRLCFPITSHMSHKHKCHAHVTSLRLGRLQELSHSERAGMHGRWG